MMKTVERNGKTLNQRTLNMLERAEARLGYGLYVVQGSYNAGGVSASGGTHDGGGALDISATSNPDEVVRALREVGFAAWHRTSSQGPWNEHIHAIAIGDGDLSSGARNQVTAYYNGRNGLVSNAPDDGPRLNPIPTWPITMPYLNATNVTKQFLADKPRKIAGIKKIQHVLNRRLNLDIVVDGIAGKQTKDAWKKWQKSQGDDTPNGIAREAGIRDIIKGYFRVKN